MIWSKDISFEGLDILIKSWYGSGNELCNPPVDAQYALNLIFKALIDDKEHYPYLTTMTESTEQVNFIMLDLILSKYSKEYRKYKRKNKR